MSIHDRLFWVFAFVFFTVAMLIGVYLKEAGISAILGIALGNAIGIFQIRKRGNTHG